MINSVSIENFQKHKSTVLKFSEGLNVIRGESHNGKSAIIKAIRWVLQNKPSGSSFRRIGNNGADTKVCIEFNDGIVERIRGDKRNCYVFGNDEYRALRTDVPSEIAHFLNINECCVQSQFDSHYLLSDSPGEVARTLNNIVGLEDIDKANKHVGRIIADANAKSKFLEAELEKHTEALKRFENLDIYEEMLESVEKLFTAAEEQEEHVNELEVVIRSIDTIEEMFVQKLNKTLEIADEVERLLGKQEEVDEIADQIVFMGKFLSNIRSGIDNVTNANLVVAVENEHSVLMKSMEDIKEISDSAKFLEDFVKNVGKLNSDLQKFDSKVAELELELKEKFDEQSVCPLCERSMK